MDEWRAMVCALLLVGSPTIANKWSRGSGFIEFCRREFFAGDCKSLGGRRLHFVVAAGDPIFGDIIRSFCRATHAIRPGKPLRIAVVERQNGASFCFISSSWGEVSVATRVTGKTSKPRMNADGRGLCRSLDRRESAFIGGSLSNCSKPS
jgi:hypothetical protein